MPSSLLTRIDETLHVVAALKNAPRWQREAEARLARQLGELFDSAGESIISELERRGVPSNDMTRRQMVQALEETTQAIQQEAADAAVDAGQHGRNRVVDTLRKAGISIPDPGDMTQATIRGIRDRTFEASAQTMKRLKGEVMETLAEAYQEGLGIDDAVDIMRDDFTGMKDFEMERIARTEIQTTQDKVAHEAIVDLGVQYEQWLTAQDERVRDGTDGTADHVALHGEIVKTGASFSNGLLHPGDRSGPIGEWINCRCRSVPFIMPEGKAPPPGLDRFRESDLIDAKSV